MPIEIFEDSDLIKIIVIEDIIFREDIIIGMGRGGNTTKEVISFTFDEYRDYNLAWYTVNNNSTEKIEKIIVDLLEKTDPIREGVLRYIYFIAKYTNKVDLLYKVEGKEWIISPFLEYIFSVEESKVKKIDIDRLNFIFNNTSKEYTLMIFIELLKRRKGNFNIINTDLIFDLIKNMSTLNYISKLLIHFKRNKESYYYIEKYTSPIDQITEDIKEKILPSNIELAYKLLLSIVATPYRYDPNYETIQLLEKVHKRLGDRAIEIIKELKKDNKNQLLGLFLDRMEKQGEVGFFNSYLSNFMKLEKEENLGEVESIIDSMSLVKKFDDGIDILEFIRNINKEFNI